MININILPQDAKNELRLRHLHLSLVNLGYVIIIGFCIINLMLLSAKLIMKNSFNRIVAETSYISRNSQSYNIRVRDINAKVNSVNLIQKDFLVWSKAFLILSEIAEEQISFSSVKVSKDSASIRTSGTATTRDALLNLKKKMETSEVFNNIEFPLENILEKTDIIFEINAGLNLAKLHN